MTVWTICTVQRSAALASQLNTRPSDVRAFLAGTLDAEHTRELTERLREAGVPI